MGLKEIAIEAYKKEIGQTNKEKITDAEKFAAKAMEILEDRIGHREFSVQVISEEPYETIFDVDSIKFRVDQYGVHIIKKCQNCGTEYQEDVMPSFNDQEKAIINIGRILLKSHDSYECEQILKEKEEKKEPTTDEKLLEALKNFMQENLENL